MIGSTLRLSNAFFVQKVCFLTKPTLLSSAFSKLAMSSQSEYPPIESTIRKSLTEQLKPVFLEVINESPMHNVPKRSESHFRVFVVSDKFNDLSLIKRHRLVNDTVKTALETAGFEFVHALSIEAKTPKQWAPEQEMEKSPPCLGGHGK